MTIANAFNTKRLDVISGKINPLSSLKATPRETQLYAINSTQRKKLVMWQGYNHIHITTEAESLKTQRIKGAKI